MAKLTLEKYTEFIKDFSQFLELPYHETSRGKAFERFCFLCNTELKFLIGFHNHENLANTFMERVTDHYKLNKWSNGLSLNEQQELLAAHVQKNWGLFLELLTKFCEPLLVKSQEKKGGE